MTEDEQAALGVIMGGAELLRNAIVKGDTQKELELRARDLLADLKGLADGKAKMVAGFKYGSYAEQFLVPLFCINISSALPRDKRP